jgi:hypothetical protein
MRRPRTTVNRTVAKSAVVNMKESAGQPTPRSDNISEILKGNDITKTQSIALSCESEIVINIKIR